MRNRYPISGIKQSYRAVPETRTVVMPVLIVLLLAGMAGFFFFGETEPGATPKEVAHAPEADLSDPQESPTSSEEETESDFLVSDSNPEVSPLLEEKTLATEEALPTETDASATVFTQWMSPLALDTYIRKKNEGFSESFWKRGHWITAVEGRWNKGTHEFRIAYEKIQDRKTWQWQYRANQTPEEFHRTALDLRAKGFTLVQSQAFDHPDQKMRYQGVWQRELPTPTVAEVSPGSLPQPTPRAADSEEDESSTMPSPERSYSPAEPIVTEITDRNLPSFQDRETPRPIPETEAPRQVTPPSEDFSSSVLNVNRLNFR